MSLWMAPAHKTLSANPSTRFIQFVFKWVDRLGMYDFFWELIPGFDRSEVDKFCLDSLSRHLSVLSIPAGGRVFY